MQVKNLMDPPAAVMSEQRITCYLQYEMDRGASENALRNYRRVTQSLYDSLPEDKIITKERLLSWRQCLKDHGYTYHTELNYIKGINRYLDFAGLSELRFNRGKPKNIAGQQFGYLTAIEPTGAKNRKDYVWRCKCKCGKEVEYPATRLLLGNTMSCGCLRGAQFKEINKYIGGTSLRQSIEERVHSSVAASGYTGVTTKRGKWKAYIKYKGQNIDLGCYDDLEDAVKARARGKELVQADALGLLDFYEELQKNAPERPTRDSVRAMQEQPKWELPPQTRIQATRSNNTSGHPGVSRKRNKWAAKITWEKVTHHLGTFESLEDAVAVRQEAERLLHADPQCFRKKYQTKKANDS